MQVFHTEAEPPNKGKSTLPNMGCRMNMSEALLNNVNANKKTGDILRLVSLCCVISIRYHLKIRRLSENIGTGYGEKEQKDIFRCGFSNLGWAPLAYEY